MRGTIFQRRSLFFRSEEFFCSRNSKIGVDQPHVPDKGIKQGRRDAAGQIVEKKFFVTQFGFDHLTENPKPHHVECNMPKIRMEKLVGDKSPDSFMGKSGINAEISKGFDGFSDFGASSEKADEKNGDIESNEPIDDERARAIQHRPACFAHPAAFSGTHDRHDRLSSHCLMGQDDFLSPRR